MLLSLFATLRAGGEKKVSWRVIDRKHVAALVDELHKKQKDDPAVFAQRFRTLSWYAQAIILALIEYQDVAKVATLHQTTPESVWATAKRARSYLTGARRFLPAFSRGRSPLGRR